MTSVLHPSSADLYELAAGELGSPRDAEREPVGVTVAATEDAAGRAELLAHVARCADCTATLRLARHLHRLHAVGEPPPGTASDALLARILATRATDQARERATLDGTSVTRALPLELPRDLSRDLPRSAQRHGGARGRAGRWVAAAAAAAVLAVLATTRSTDLSAVEAESTLQITPMRARAGDTLTVRYVPAVHLFPRAARLVLRARLRTAQDESYDWSLPTRTIATLVREGEAYVGRAVLPPDVVYAALAVEDSAATRVDDRTGRPWEVLRFDGDTAPAFDALHQRSEEMLGRSWEEGHATARRVVAAYPARLDAWTMLAFYERQLRGEGDPPTPAEAAADARAAALIATARERASLTPNELATLVYRATWRMRDGKTAADSATYAYWLARLAREAPGHWQLSQQVALNLWDVRARAPRLVLDSLERVYARAIAGGGEVRGIVFPLARMAADSARDTAAFHRWTARLYVGATDSAAAVARELVERPAFRDAAMQALRAALRDSADAPRARPRRLDETAAAHARALVERRRRLLAALGHALLARGDTAAAQDTLARAAGLGWAPTIFADLARVHAAAGDAAAAARVGARLGVDPNTPPARRDSLAAAGRAALGAAGWTAAVDAARREMAARTLERSVVQPVRGTPRLRDANGQVRTLAELTEERPAVVIFWSRQCGFAIEAAPALQRAAERLRASGAPVLLVVDEPLSAAVRAAARKAGLTLPLHQDVDGTVTRGLSNFGTPSSHVLDALGRVRFRGSEPEDLARQVAALRGDA